MSKKYEALIIFAKDVRQDNLEEAIGRFVAEIAKFGANVESTEAIGARDFAREINKRRTGIFGKVRFDIDPAQLTPMRERFRLYEEVYRMQIVLRNERVEAAKAKDDARRAAYEEKRKAAAAAEAEASAQ